MSIHLKKSTRFLLYVGLGALSFIGFTLGFSEKGTTGKVVTRATDLFGEEAEASHSITTTSQTTTTRGVSNSGDDDDDGVSGTSLLKTPNSTR